MRSRINRVYWAIYHTQRCELVECRHCINLLIEAMNILLELDSELKEKE